MAAELPWTDEDEAAIRRANAASDPWATRVWMQFNANNLPPVRRFVLLLLGDHYRGGGRPPPPVPILVHRARASISVVELAIREGKRLGLLDADGRPI